MSDRSGDGGGCVVVILLFCIAGTFFLHSYGQSKRWGWALEKERRGTIWVYDRGQARSEKIMRLHNFLVWGGGIDYQTIDGAWHKFNGPYQFIIGE